MLAIANHGIESKSVTDDQAILYVGRTQDSADILNYIANDNPDAVIAGMEKIDAKCLLLAGRTPLTRRCAATSPKLGRG